MYSLKVRQVCLFFIAFIPVTKLFMLPSVIASFANEDMWICTLINILLDFFTIAVLLFTFKDSDCDFLGLIEKKFGKKFMKVIVLLYVLYFFLKSILPVAEQKDYVELTLYVAIPNVFTFIPFFILPLFLSFKHLRIIGRLSDIAWFSTILGIIVLVALSVSNADFSSLLPVGANGINKIIKGSFSSLNWFGDSAYFLFFIGHFKRENKYKLKIILSYIFAGVIIVFFMAIFYSVFSSIAFRQRFALTEISKYSTVISNIGRFDYLGIFLILFSNLFGMALPLYFATRLLYSAFPIKYKAIYPLITVSLNALLTIVLNRYFSSVEKFIISYAGWYFILFSNVLPMLSIFIKKKEKKIENEV